MDKKHRLMLNSQLNTLRSTGTLSSRSDRKWWLMHIIQRFPMLDVNEVAAHFDKYVSKLVLLGELDAD